ncbi:MAG: Na+/H+ antiporter NhaC family protein [Peptostreptococcaceae bacterium]|nr:Na+/H+ antiporter NhaC family protein [Peptostreptococcaceae bacterium]
MKEKKKPSFMYSLVTMVLVFSVIMVPSLAWGSKINALFLISWIVAMIMCMGTGTTYKEIQKGIVDNCSRAIVPAMIILCVGALVGTWNASGTVPMVIRFGVRSVSPNLFLMTAFLLCATTALITGTSWGTFGTAGLALAGIGISLNVNPVLTAGACCGGAFFGDTISPVSDSPNLASAVSGVDLFKGIRHQAKVTVTSAVICCILYYFLGMKYGEGNVNTDLIHEIVDTIGREFHTGFITLLPMIFVIVLLAGKVPSIPAILGGAIFGGVIACLYQGDSLPDVISYFWSGYKIESGVEFVDKLLNRGGVTSMSGTAVMFLFAFGLFGILNSAGIVDAFVEPMTSKLNSKLSLVLAAVAFGIFGAVVGASMNFAYAFAGSIMAPVFEKKRLQKKNLMRALGVGCTAMAVIVPWSLSSSVAVEFLGVKPLELVPYNFFLMVTPIVLILMTLFGRDTKWLSEVSEEERQEELEGI